MTTKRRHKHLRTGLMVLLLITAAVSGFGIWFASHYKPMLLERIPGWVAKATDSLYKVKVDDLSINIFTRRVTIRGLHAWLDTNQLNKLKAEQRDPNVFYKANIPLIRVRGIEWENIAANNEFKCRIVAIINPDIRISSVPKVADSLRQATDSLRHLRDSLSTKKEKKPIRIEKVFIQQVAVSHPHLTYENRDSSGRVARFKLDEGSIVLTEFIVDPEKPADNSRLFYARDATINIDSCQYTKDKFLYTIRANDIRFSTGNDTLSLAHFSLRPNVSREVFYKTIGHQHDMFTLSFPSVAVQGFDWRKLRADNVLTAQTVYLDEPVLEDYFTRLAPANMESKKGKYPNQLIVRMKQKLDIRSIKIRNGHVKYTEVNERTKLAGVLKFDGIDGSVSNATNLPERLSQNGNCVIKLNGRFMKNSPMSATFNLSLTDASGAFTVDGSMRDMDQSQINAIAKALAVTEIESVQLHKIDLHVSGNENSGQGTVTMLYNNLKIAMQKIDSSKQLKDKPVLSFLANKLVIYPDNPMKDEPVRTESSVVARDQYKSFFNLIWKCIFNSVQKTAVRSDNIEQALEEKQKHPNEKRGLLKRIFGGKDKKKDKK